MASKELIGALRLLVLLMVLQRGISSKTSRCKFPAIFNFGDSNSDTGAINAALAPVLPPNGENFFGNASGRICDGRLIIDFIAEELKFPYLRPYLDSLGTSFKHGANFATSGSSIRRGGFSPFDFAIQIYQFMRFKSFISELYNSNRKKNPLKSKLPRPKDFFSKALYTIDIGQNDLSYGFRYTTVGQVNASIPDILDKYSLAIHQLYNEGGARAFWVHNTGPIGCVPNNVKDYKPYPSNLDQNGCVKIQNDMAQEFNRQLKDRVLKLRTELPLAVFIYVDVYSAKYALISHAKAQGFVDPFGSCIEAKCNNPKHYISWDGIHYTQAANMWVANHILNGSFSYPPVSIGETCHRHINV